MSKEKAVKKETTDKKPFYKQVWFWVVVVICLIGIGAAGSSSKDAKLVGNNGGETEQVAEGATEFKVGDIIGIDEQEVTVISVERNYSTGSSYFTPDEGKEYVKVNVQIQNKSKETKSYNALYFEMEDGNGVIQSYMPAMFAQADDNLGSGDLAAGGTKKGSIVFEVPAGDTGLKLHFKPNVLSSREAVIKL